MQRSTLLTLLAVLLLVLLRAPGARGAEGTAQVVVLEARVQGDIKPQEQARLGDAVWAALDRLGLRRVAETDRDAVLAGEAGLRECLEKSECLERLGRLLEAGYVLGLSASRSGTGYHAEVRLFDVEVGEIGAALEWSCASCSLDDLARRVDGLAEEAVRKDQGRPRATLVVRSSVPSAEVLLDGRRIGFTPLERRVLAGPHEVLVSAERLGLQPEQVRVEVSGGQRMVLSLSPGERVRVAARPGAAVKEPSPVPAQVGDEGGPPRRSRWKLGLGVPLAALGLVGVGLGGASLALDGRCTGDGPPCPQVYDTRVPGIAEVVVGAALLAGGVALVAADVVAGRRQRVAVVPVVLVGGGGISMSGSF